MKIITKALLLSLLALSAAAEDEGALIPSEDDYLEDEIEDVSEDGVERNFLRGRELWPGWCRHSGHCRWGYRW